MEAFWNCGPCGESYPLGANAVRARKTAGLHLLEVACPTCGNTWVVDATEDVFRAVERWLADVKRADIWAGASDTFQDDMCANFWSQLAECDDVVGELLSTPPVRDL
jgi:hypothetical protein